MSGLYIKLTEPGVYDGIPHEAYVRDPVEGGSLSSTGARKLLPPSCPAKFRWEQLHGSVSTPAMTLGTAAHRLVLGVGAEIQRVETDAWRTKAAKAAKADAIERGRTPLLAKDHDTVQEMAEALRADPIASALFAPGSGLPEQTLVWRDERTGMMCRAKLDWLPHAGQGRLILADYKTCTAADFHSLQRATHQLGYHQQAEWYLSGVKALGIGIDPADWHLSAKALDPAFLLVFQEVHPPWIVHVVELDTTAMQIGAARNRWALDTYRHCTETDTWPAYAEGITYLGLPRWAEIQEGS